MSLGSQSVVVNGQRIDAPTHFQYTPYGYGPQTIGVPQVSPSMPPYLGAGAAGSSAMGAGEDVGGYGTAGNNQQVTAIAAANPYSLKVSPVWWAVIALLVGLMLLKGVHWRDTVLEGASEKGNVGPVKEAASESA
jgi:hypothetical protein